MTPPKDQLARIRRLRALFLDDDRGGLGLPDYWRDRNDLAAYDALLGARIGWKWHAALRECKARGWPRQPDAVVLDHGCGSGIAARTFLAHFPAREVLCHDRSPVARAFAAERLAATNPGVVARPLVHIDSVAPDVLLVSHVLGELDERGREQLRALILRSRCVLIVEPGSRTIARSLAALRDELLATFQVIAPCPHAAHCPTLATANDWCHFFAPPPAEVFTNGDWIKMARAVGIDQRALPYSFLALAREPAASPAPPLRGLGRADVGKHTATVQVCADGELRTLRVQRRTEPALWRRLRKDPADVRVLGTAEPPATPPAS